MLEAVMSGASAASARAAETAPDLAYEHVADRFERIAARCPAAIAARQDGLPPLTYAELDRRSARLAARLVAAGAGPGRFVALAATRSIDAVIAIVGIVRSGSAYVPLDPGYPDAQLAVILEETQPLLVLADAAMRLRLCGMVGGAVVDALETCVAAAGPADDAARREPAARDAEDPIYVMYTSGSTGRPKGVVVPHRGVSRLVTGQDYCDLGPDEVILQLAPLAFDASTFELWGALLNGGALAIVADEHPSTDRVAAVLRAHGVTTAWFTAGLFHLLVDTQIEALAGLRQLLAGGDVLSPDHVRRFQAAAPECRLINGYGPTENTTFTCCATISRGDWASESVQIGRAIAGTQAYVVDAALKPVPSGEEGQLVAAGAGLARGYLGQSALTAEKFVAAPAPISARVYLTGDLARVLPGGEIEFRGRIDRQIKINGKRIEPGEIEAALRAGEGVRDAAAIVDTTRSGLKRIMAFIATGEVGPARMEAIRIGAQTAAQRLLPDFLVPARITAVEVLPITPNGKLDRDALLGLLAAADAAAAIGGDDLEGRIAAIWQSVLGLDRVGRDDVFFDLGGRSLQLMQVHAALQQATGRQIRITEMFARPTIRALAELLGGAPRSDGGRIDAEARERAMRQRAAAARRRRPGAG